MVGRYSGPVIGRRMRPLMFAGVLLLTILLGVRNTSAQEASPAASPVAAVDCTTVLGVGSPGDACVNIIQASPAAGEVDVYMDGTLVLSGLEFKQASGVFAVVADFHAFVVVPAGSDIAEATPLVSFNHNFLFAGGDLVEFAIVGAAPPIFAEAHTVDLSDLADDMVRVRAVHASADAPTVDVAVAGGDVIAGGLSFPRGSGYVEVVAGSYDLEVRPTGTTDAAASAQGVELQGAAVVSAFLVGSVADGTLELIVTVYPLGGGVATPVPVPVASPAA